MSKLIALENKIIEETLSFEDLENLPPIEKDIHPGYNIVYSRDFGFQLSFNKETRHVIIRSWKGLNGEEDIDEMFAYYDDYSI